MKYGQTIRIRVPRDLAEWVRQRALQEGVTVSEVVRQAVERYLPELSDDDSQDADDDDSLHVRLRPRQRDALEARGNVERLVRQALARMRLRPPPIPSLQPTAAFGKPAEDLCCRMPTALHTRLVRHAQRCGVSRAALMRYALVRQANL
jgi:predicted DNA-binding protein